MISAPVLSNFMLIAPYLLLTSTQGQFDSEWQQIQYTSVPEITGRASHAGAFLSSTNEYLVFCGYGSNQLNDFHSINLTSLQSSIVSASTPLNGRRFMAFTSDHTSNIYFHGGLNNLVYFDDFWRFNVQTRNWTQLAKRPSFRIGHCLESDTIRNQLILFGGWTGLAYLNDLWTYSIAANQWQQSTLAVNSTRPVRRDNHACTFNDQAGTFYVHGGETNLKDLWQFNFTSNQWDLMDSGNDNVTLRRHSIHYSLPHNSIFCFLGAHSDSEPQNSIYQYSLDNRLARWQLFQVKSPQVPAARSGFSTGFNSMTGDYFIFGGVSTDNARLNDLWTIHIEYASGNNYEVSSAKALHTNTESPSASIISNTTFATVSKTDQELLNKSKLQSRRLETLATFKPTSQDLGPPAKSFLTLLEDFRTYVIVVGSVLLLLILIFCIWCRRRRRRREMQKHSLGDKSVITELSTSGTNKVPTTMSQNTQSSSTDYSTSSTTVVSTELGLSVPGYLQVDSVRSFRINRILTEGGFGVVALADAFDPKLKQYGDQVIVKQMKKSRFTDRDVQLFYQEISLMEYFQGEQYIAKLLGYSIDPYCLVMKYYPMGSLTRVIKNTRNRCKIHVLTFTQDIAKGFMAMHSKGVVHNDMKPDNVLVDHSPETGKPFCVLSDLGISQVITEEILKVRAFQVTEIRALSIAYSAPERLLYFRNKSAIDTIDQQVIFSWDIYALGIVMFELLTGKTQLYENWQ